jgi:hypothetical protein
MCWSSSNITAVDSFHSNVTAHPTAQWTLQQLREAVGYEERSKYLLHDRDAIFSAELDESIRRLG